MTDAGCPADDALIAFHQGDLPLDQAEALSAHLEGCARCEEFLNALDEGEKSVAGLLREPSARPTSAPQAASAAETRGSDSLVVGRYKLIEPLGEGGMGSVYMAQQSEPIRRLVAVKLIRPGMDNRQILARFEAERQALALMDHPNIAKVLDGGATPDGRPYFAMELVKGTPITRYCDVHRLSIRERLELFVPVCRAVQHAHQKGIIHRDIKPSNVLVARYDGQPVPKVIDFGVAKAIGQPLTDRTLVTNFGAVVGTPEYMAPEQAEINQVDVDTRCDIYALGVLLYQLLTGSTPLARAKIRNAAFAEVLRLIREDEPSRPSTRLIESKDTLASISAERSTEPDRLSRLVRGDLDWVVMKSLEKDRRRRYETANGFARDIQRFLDGDAVEACPPTSRYRIGKFARKHRVFLATAGAFAALLVAATVASSTLAYWANRERERAMAAEHLAAAQRDRAVVAEQRAMDQKRRALSREQMAIDAVRRFGEVVRDNPELKNNPDLGPLRRKLLQEPQSFFQHLRNELQQDRETTFEALVALAESLTELGRLTDEIGDQHDAFQAYEQTLPIWERLVRDDPSRADFRAAWAESLYNIGRSHQAASRFGEARAAYESALALRKRLARDEPSQARYQSDLGQSYHSLGSFYDTVGQQEKSSRAREQAVQIREQLVRDDPSNVQYQSDLAKSYHNLGSSEYDGHPTSVTRPSMDQAREIQERLARDHPAEWRHQIDLALTYNNMGVALDQRGRPAEAIALFERALAIHERLARDHPSNSRVQSDLSWDHVIIAHSLHEMGRDQEASAAHERALTMRQLLAQDNPTNVTYQRRLGWLLSEMAELRRVAGRTTEAMELFRKAQSIHDRLAEDQPADPMNQYSLGSIHNAVGQLHLDLGRRAEALASFRLALANQERLALEVFWNVRYQDELYWQNHLVGELLAEAGLDAEALTLIENALALRERLTRDEPVDTAFGHGLAPTLGDHAGLKRQHGQAAEILVRLRQTQATCYRTVGPDPSVPIKLASLVWLQQRLCQLYAAAGRHTEADRSFALVRELRAKLDDHDPALGDLDARLLAARGGAIPADAAARTRLALRAFNQGRYALSARLFEGPENSNGYTAACASALALAGRGLDEPPLDDDARGRLRRLALRSLRGELAEWTRVAAEDTPEARRRVAAVLRHWRRDFELDPIRADRAVQQLPEPDREEFRRFWIDVDQLLARADAAHP